MDTGKGGVEGAKFMTLEELKLWKGCVEDKAIKSHNWGLGVKKGGYWRNKGREVLGGKKIIRGEERDTSITRKLQSAGG